jgi:hypothetical protein
MMVKTLEKAIIEAKRFLTAAEVLRKAGKMAFKGSTDYCGGRNVASVKRASMDLTKALAEVRR